MNKPLALFDIDKVMFNGLSYFPLLDAQIEEGLVEAEVGEQAQNTMSRYKEQTLGYEDFVKQLLDIYADGLKGKSVDEVEESTGRFFNQTSDFFGYVEPTIELLSPTHEVALVTGSSQFTAGAVAKVFGVQRHISTQLDVDEGTLTGRVASYLATRHEKRSAIYPLTRAHPYEGSFAFGDSEGDIEMLQVVEHPLCIQPTTGLREVAREKGWQVVESNEELTSPSALTLVRLALK